MNGELNMITITMSKENDIAKLFWCGDVLGDSKFEFHEPMQLTFYNNKDRFLYMIAWAE